MFAIGKVSRFVFYSLCVGLLGSANLLAGVTGSKGEPVPAQVVEWKDIVARDQARIKAGIKESPTVIPIMHRNKNEQVPAVNSQGSQPTSPIPSITPNAKAPATLLSFSAKSDNGLFIPPDTMGAAGPSNLIVVHNGTFRIQTKTGGLVSDVSLNSFWGRTNTFDPKVYWDQDIGRWITISCVSAGFSNSAVLVGVSSTSDPTQSWYLRSFDADPANTTWADYPGVGFNQKWIAVSMNMFTNSGNSFKGAKMWVFDITSTSNPGTVVPTIFPTSFDTAGSGSGFTLIPCHTFGTQTNLFILDSGWATGPNNFTRVSFLSGPASTPVWSELGFADVQDFGFPPPVSQFGSSSTIDSGDTRIMNAVFRNGCMWYAQTGGFPSASPTHCVALWHQVSTDLSLSVIQQGAVEDVSGTINYWFPSIAVTPTNDIGLGFSGCGTTQYVGAYYTGRSHSDSLNTMQSVNLLKAGEGPYFKGFSTGENRWGDYSQTCIDPSDDNIWTIQEYSLSATGLSPDIGVWATWWGKFSMISVNTTPPYYADIPDVKLFINQPALSPAFNLADYNTGGSATTYSQGPNNFLANSSVVGSNVNELNYTSATSGSNSYIAANPFGTVTSANKVKYSTYKLKKLPQVELFASSTTFVQVSNYAYNSVGSALPPSFGTSSAIIVSNLSLVTAYWDTTSTKVIIVSQAGFNSASSPVNVDVIAAPTAFPFGSDLDKERIVVYPIVSTTAFDFSNASDTSNLAYAIPAGASTLASIGYSASTNDGGGNASHGGALAVNFTAGTDGVKITPAFSAWMSNVAGTFYTLRARVFGTNTVNNYLQLLFNGAPGSTPTDIQGYYRFAVPTSWTTIEVPISSLSAVSTGPAMYPQLVLKGNGATGTIFIDEIHVYQGTPTVIGASRYVTSDNFTSGYWNDTTALNSWSIQNITGTPGLSVSNGSLNATFTGGTQTGVKLTALSNSTSIYILNTTPGKQAGMHMQTSLVSGVADLINTQVQVNLLGAAGPTGVNAFVQAVDLAAAAEIGRVSGRTMRMAFNPNNNYYQVQFVLKGLNSQIIQVDNTVGDLDNDDPNYGDLALFP